MKRTRTLRTFLAGLVVAAVLGTASAQAPATPAPKLDLNHATREQLLAGVPDLGPRMVGELLEYRPYLSIRQFRAEIGKYVGADVVGGYEAHLFVPIDVDASDAATLAQIPGVDASVADDLIAARPFGSNDAFLERLGHAAPDVDLQLAAEYLAATGG